eukprot:gene54142-74116_t
MAARRTSGLQWTRIASVRTATERRGAFTVDLVGGERIRGSRRYRDGVEPRYKADEARQIMVGNVPVGGDAPVTVQTMTNTPTSDPRATIDQIRRCEDAGVDIIRVSCPDVESTAALKQIVRASRVPIVADIHFHYKRALEAADA